MRNCPDGTTRVDVLLPAGFDPPTVEIAAGTTVCWKNPDGWTHTATSDTGEFDSGVIALGDIYCFTFDTPGSYPYHDELHPLTGIVNVHSGPPPPLPISCPPPPPPPPAPGCPVGSRLVNILPYFDPYTVYAVRGETVCWWNRGDWPRRVISDTGDFDSGDLGPGSTYFFTFDKPGSYAYHEELLSWLTGRIEVASAPPPPWVECGTGTTRVDVNLGYGFAPQVINVAPGTTVCWKNQDGWTHTATSDTGVFDSGVIRLADTYSFTFHTPGSYSYHDALHPELTGTVNVTAGGGHKNRSFRVPRVVGLKLSTARARIRRSKGSVGRVRRVRSRRVGRVIGQKPAPGKRLARGARVSLVVGRR